MQIKRRLTALAKRMNPEIETMNRVLSFNETIDAMEQAVDYCESKIARRKKAEETGETAAMRTRRKAGEAQAEAERLQDLERKEYDEDQQQRAAQPDAVTDEPIVIENVEGDVDNPILVTGDGELVSQPATIGNDDAGSKPSKTE